VRTFTEVTVVVATVIGGAIWRVTVTYCIQGAAKKVAC